MEDLRTDEVAEEVEVKEAEKIEDEKKYSDKDIDEIVNKKFSKWQQQQEKKIAEEKKLAEMNASEKAAYETKQLKEELEELRAAKTQSEMTKIARGMLVENSVSIDDELLSVLVTKEAETTKSNVDSFIKTFNAEVEKAVNEKLKGKTPTIMTGGKLSREDILKIPNQKDRQKAISENLELFK